MSNDAPSGWDTRPERSAGSLLKAARLAQGLQLVTLAAQLKISARKLEALEEDRLDELQGSTYVRALAQAACRALKMDPTEVLARLPRSDHSTLEQVSGGLNAPFRERQTQLPLINWVKENRLVVGVGAVLLLAAYVLWVAPPGFWLDRLPKPQREAQAPAAAPAASEPTPVSAPAASVSLDTPAIPSSGLSASTPVGRLDMYAPAATPAPAPSSATVAGSAPTVRGVGAVGGLEVAQTPASAVPNPDRGSAMVVRFEASQESWVTLSDGAGKKIAGKLLKAGDVLSAEAVAPFRVTVGNAAGTRLEVGGKAIDLTNVARDNVAHVDFK